MGLVFFILGLEYFLNVLNLPKPENQPELAQQFGAALFAPLYGNVSYGSVVKALEVLGGINLLSGRFALLGIAILLPIAINILLFDIFIMRSFGAGFILVPLLLFILFGYRNAAKPVFDGTARIG